MNYWIIRYNLTGHKASIDLLVLKTGLALSSGREGYVLRNRVSQVLTCVKNKAGLAMHKNK